MNRIVSLLLIAIVFLACNNSNDTPIDDAVNLRTPEEDAYGKDSILMTRTFTTAATEQQIRVEVSDDGSGQGNLINIVPQDFAKGATLTFRADSILNFLQADLNQDGFDELYIVVAKKEDAETLKKRIIGVASDRDLSLEPIVFEDSVPKGLPAGKEYRGWDGYEIRNSVLVRTFPLYTNHAAVQKEETFEIEYQLVHDAADWRLVPVRSKRR